MSTCVTDLELRAWMAGCGPTPERQLARVKHLWRHADADRMSESDRALCRRALVMLEEDRERASRCLDV